MKEGVDDCATIWRTSEPGNDRQRAHVQASVASKITQRNRTVSQPVGVAPFLLLPVVFLARMMLNAIDGMLAREFGQQSALGAYMNELADVVSDAALYLPFAFVMPFGPWPVGFVLGWLMSQLRRRKARA